MFDRRCVRGLLLLCLAAVVTTLVGCNSPGLVSIQISPSASFFGGPGLTEQLTAFGTFSYGDHPQTQQDITKIVTWQSSAPGVASVNSPGMLTSGNNYGTVVITASMQGFTGLVTGQTSVTVCQKLNSTNTGCSD
ncbi:MAG: hypothetical protein WA869_15835 [Alloacidobacterium sp.]|jgi:hypothetical protein